MTSGALTTTAERIPTHCLNEISRFPMLSLGEEQALVCRWRDQRDVDATNKLVSSHLRLVAKIAMGYGGYGLPIGDLVSEGNVGMVQAVKRVDPDRGIRLATYAMWWIRAAIQEFILHSSPLVKMGTTGAQKKLFFNQRRLKRQMQATDDGDLKPEQVAGIARILDVPKQEVVNMNRRLGAPDHSLNATLRQGRDGEWQDWLMDETDSQETTLADREELSDRKARLSNAFKKLSQRERHIIVERWLKDNPTTLGELSQRYGVSRERVRQIKTHGRQKLRNSMKAHGAHAALV